MQIKRYDDLRREFTNNFAVNNIMLDLMYYLEQHQAESLLRDFMEYKITHEEYNEVPF